MNIAVIALKAAVLVVAALVGFWAASALGGFDAPTTSLDADCGGAKLRACFFAII